MKTLADFKPGDVVIQHYQEYSCETRDYTPAKRMAIVKSIRDTGVVIETERGQNPDYNKHVGAYCLDTLEHVETMPNVIPLRKVPYKAAE